MVHCLASQDEVALDRLITSVLPCTAVEEVSPAFPEDVSSRKVTLPNWWEIYVSGQAMMLSEWGIISSSCARETLIGGYSFQESFLFSCYPKESQG